METEYLAGMLGRPDLAATAGYYQPVVQEGGAMFQGSADVTGVGTGQASLTMAGVLVLVMIGLYWATRGRQH